MHVQSVINRLHNVHISSLSKDGMILKSLKILLKCRIFWLSLISNLYVIVKRNAHWFLSNWSNRATPRLILQIYGYRYDLHWSFAFLTWWKTWCKVNFLSKASSKIIVRTSSREQPVSGWCLLTYIIGMGNDTSLRNKNKQTTKE